MARKRKIVLKQVADVGHTTEKTYEVVSLVDSIEFDIGQIVTNKEADDLCCSKCWTVTIRA